MAERKKKIGVRLHKNPLKSKEAAPYIATVVPNGHVGLDEFLAGVAKRLNTTHETARYFWDGMMEVVGAELAAGHKVKTPIGLFEPAISGSLDTADAPLDPTRNKVYVKVTPTPSMRKALKKLEVERIDMPTSDLAIATVISPQLVRKGYNAIRVGEPFTVSGSGLTDEVEANVTDAKGTVQPLTIELAKGPSMICRVTGALSKGPAELKVFVTGGEDGDVLFTASRKIKIV